MDTVVMKFGGAAVATPERFAEIAEIIIGVRRQGTRVAVVVSAMAHMTDQLIGLAHQVNSKPSRREMDMLVSVGERISIALLAMALGAKGQEAISFTGSQSGIITDQAHCDARIMDVRPHRLVPLLDEGKVVIVAGFQGVSFGKEITTLGRGGSDTTAVALGIALKAQGVWFYKDVEGVFNADPKTDAEAVLFPELSYDEAIAIVDKGAKVLHPRCLRLAQANGIPLRVVPFASPEAQGTVIGCRERTCREPLYETS